MARISGVDIPKSKRGEIALTYIYGVGRNRASKILNKAKVDLNKKVSDWTDSEIKSIIQAISKYKDSWILVLIEVLGIGLDYHFEVKKLKIILEQEKEREKQLLIKRKLLNN
jgi:ribosomal protein S13